MNSEGITNKQIKNLKDLLRKLDYNKEELGQLENLKTILLPNYTNEEIASLEIESYFESLEQEWIEISEKSWHQIIRFLINRFERISQDRGTGLEWLISKIAYDLYIKYDKTISQGQAEAVLKRALGITLSSTGRTQLYELRKKIRKYENFLAHFGELVKTHEFTFKVVILGLNSKQASNLLTMAPIPGGEGKIETIGVEFYPKTIEIYDKSVKLQLWDISSDIQWRSFIQTYCKGAHGAIIVYDKSNQDSFESAKELYNELKEGTNLKFRLRDKPRIFVDLPVILIGLSNGDNVVAAEGQSLAKNWNTYGYIEMKDTESQNFEKVLDSLSYGIISNYHNGLKRSTRKIRFKITVVGDIEVGKTSIIKKFTLGTFSREDKTIGAQFSMYTKEIEGDKIKILFWDIAGGKEFHHLRQSFFNKSLGTIIVFSLGDEIEKSLYQISYWHKEIMKYCGDIPIIVIANKTDLVDETKVDISKIQDFVKKNKFLGIYLTSAKTGHGIANAFNRIIEEVYKKYE